MVSQPHPKIWDGNYLPFSCAAFRLCRNGEAVIPLLILHDAEVQDASTRGHALSRVSMSDLGRFKFSSYGTSIFP